MQVPRLAKGHGFKGPAVFKFMVLCGAQIIENHAIRQDHIATAKRAAKGDLAAALHLGDF